MRIDVILKVVASLIRKIDRDIRYLCIQPRINRWGEGVLLIVEINVVINVFRVHETTFLIVSVKAENKSFRISAHILYY